MLASLIFFIIIFFSISLIVALAAFTIFVTGYVLERFGDFWGVVSFIAMLSVFLTVLCMIARSV